MKSALAIAAIWGCTFAVGSYGALRALQYVLFPEANPATIVWSAHAGYFWRMLIVTYCGGMAAIVAFLVARSDVDRAVKGLLPALTVSAAILTAQGLLLP